MIQLVNLEKAYGIKTILSKVKFQFPSSERIALVGPNGAGKTTLLNIICGLEKQDDGQVVIPANILVGYLPQTPNPLPEPTVLEEAKAGHGKLTELAKEMARLLTKINALDDKNPDLEALVSSYEICESNFLSEGGYSLESRALSILKGLGFSEMQLQLHPTSLSGGWRMRLELARLLISKPDFLVLDEPTNHLDLPSLVWIESWLMNFRGTLLFVSHDRELLTRLPTMILSLERGRLEAYTGNFERFLDQRDAKLEQERSKSEQLRQRREAMEQFVKRFGAKASKAKQAQSRMKMIARIRDLEADFDGTENNYTFDIALPTPQRTPRLVVELEDLAIGYEKALATGIHCSVEKGAKIAVIGANGIGKSTLLKSIASLIPVKSGQIIPCPELKVSYFSQDHSEFVSESKSVLDFFLEQTSLGEKESRNFLGNFKFQGDDVYKKTSVLSGGELSRLALASAVARRSGLLLLDEPTNHLDMATVEGLIAALDEFEGTVIFVSHDRNFINGVCTHIFAMLPDGRSQLFPGKLDDYERLAQTSGFPNVLQVEVEPKSETTKQTSTKANHESFKELKSQKSRLEKRIKSVEVQIDQTKKSMHDLETELLKVPPDNHQEMMRLAAKLKLEEKNLEDLESKWLHDCEELEKLG